MLHVFAFLLYIYQFCALCFGETKDGLRTELSILFWNYSFYP
jgi:hypothetical protein